MTAKYFPSSLGQWPVSGCTCTLNTAVSVSKYFCFFKQSIVLMCGAYSKLLYTDQNPNSEKSSFCPLKSRKHDILPKKYLFNSPLPSAHWRLLHTDDTSSVLQLFLQVRLRPVGIQWVAAYDFCKFLSAATNKANVTNGHRGSFWNNNKLENSTKLACPAVILD